MPTENDPDKQQDGRQSAEKVRQTADDQDGGQRDAQPDGIAKWQQPRSGLVARQSKQTNSADQRHRKPDKRHNADNRSISYGTRRQATDDRREKEAGSYKNGEQVDRFPVRIGCSAPEVQETVVCRSSVAMRRLEVLVDDVIDVCVG